VLAMRNNIANSWFLAFIQNAIVRYFRLSINPVASARYHTVAIERRRMSSGLQCIMDKDVALG